MSRHAVYLHAMNASPIDTMIPSRHAATSRADARSCAVLTRRAQWTGRSRVSSETNTVLAHISTSGFHCTRVSALRNSADDAASCIMHPVAQGTTTSINTQAGMKPLLR
jgi:hypothetical protein